MKMIFFNMKDAIFVIKFANCKNVKNLIRIHIGFTDWIFGRF